MAFKGAQVFYVSKQTVNNSAEVGVSAINLYFKQKPTKTNNRSGILAPGVNLFVVEAVGTGFPDLGQIETALIARVEWEDIQVSSDATLATTFRFPRPISVKTNKQYSFVVKFDGEEDFVLHSSELGQLLFGTDNQNSTISSDPNVGQYYNYISPQNPQSVSNENDQFINTGTATGENNYANTEYLSQFWKPTSTSVLKFDVFVARYSYNGDFDLGSHSNNVINSNSYITIINGKATVDVPQFRYEYFTYDRATSLIKDIGSGQVYQEGPLWPNDKAPATISGSSNSLFITAISNTINWSTLLNPNVNDEYIIVISNNHYGANAHGVAIRRVMEIVSNTSIRIDRPLPFSNTAANFRRSPVAYWNQSFKSRVFGRDSIVGILRDSNANSSMRFVSDSLNGISILNGGSGYSNSDVITFSGYESVTNKIIGNYPAIANISVNANGTIDGIYFSNTGAGFVNTANITMAITNSSSLPSTGANASFGYSTGSFFRTEANTTSGSHFANCDLINLEVADIIPALDINNPTGTAYRSTHRLPYYAIADNSVADGYVYYCDGTGAWDEYEIKNNEMRRSFTNTKSRVLPSWSNELTIPYANGSSSGGLGGNTSGPTVRLTSNASVIRMVATSNNDFVAAKIEGFDNRIKFLHYIINNDYTDEHTNYGAAWAKGIEVKFNLANNSFAEDLIVDSTVYRPPNSNVVAFARLYNSNDPYAFDDRDWTMLRLVSGGNTFSSSVDLNDTIEMTWTLPPFPNTAITMAGVANTTLGSVTITGTGTSWQSNATANLIAGDMIKIYSPLFPDNYQIALVNAVASDSSMTINTPVSNNNIVGPMTIDKIGYPHQTFKNDLNSGIARYYNLDGTEFDTFNVIQLKFVLVSSNTIMVPMLDDIRATAVSA